MSIFSPTVRSLAILVVLVLTGVAAAQDNRPAPANATEPGAEAPPAAETAPAADADVSDLPTPEMLRLELLPLRRDALAVEVGAWVERVQAQAQVVADLLMEGDGADKDALQKGRAKGAVLIQLAQVGVDALEAKGGDTSEFGPYIKTLASEVSGPNGAPADARAEIPSLGPYDPLAVTTEELAQRLRRFRRAGLENEIETWLGRLQTKTEQIAATDITARNATGDEQTALISLSTELKAERTALIDRAEVAIKLLEARGGDATEYRQYVKAVSGGLAADLAALAAADGNAVQAATNTIVAWAKSKEGGIAVATNLGKFLATLIVAWFLAAICSRLLAGTLKRLRRAPSSLLQTFLRTMVRRIIMLVGLVVAISNLGFDIAPLVAAIGAAGLVIGFALQGTLSNFASGILILLYRPYDVGDGVEVAGVSGKVAAMTMVSTTITTVDNQLLIVPNNAVWNNVIKNITGQTTRRVDMVFGIGYGDDMETAKKILTDVVTNHPLVLPDPAPVIRVNELADSSVNFIVRPWARTSDYWDVYWDLTQSVKERFDGEGISIPFPQRDVHMHQVAPT